MNDEICNISEAFEIMGSKWKLIIVNNLVLEEKRFNELKRSTDASSRTLSRILKELQTEGIVQKRIEEGTPIATYYSLTEKGQAFRPVLEEMDIWAREWLTN